jgi:hypothetical protein
MQERKIERSKAVRIMCSEQAKPKAAGGKGSNTASGSRVLGKIGKAIKETTTANRSAAVTETR